jgi:AcrR family transcriptional regulator
MPMESSQATGARPGLRERKKQQTRDTIARVAVQLFAERGYDQTTLAEIADAADVSTRTIFAYYQSKEDILFCDLPELVEQLKHTLDTRAGGVTTIDALRDFIAGMEVKPDETVLERKKIIAANETLRLGERARFSRIEELVAESIAKDLDAGPGDVRPPLVAASMMAAFRAARERLESDSGEPMSHDQAMAVLDDVLVFLRGGLEGLKRA